MIEEKVRALVEKPITDLGYILDSVSYELEDNVQTLKIVIDAKGIVTIDDVVKVTETVNPIMDENNPIEEFYVLDISSKEKGSI